MKVYACAMCDHKTTMQDELRDHVVAKHLSVKMNVQKMEVNTKSNDANVESIKCDKCKCECRLNIQLRKHYKIKHCQQFHCDKCDFTAESDAFLTSHIENNHTSISCLKCDSFIY